MLFIDGMWGRPCVVGRLGMVAHSHGRYAPPTIRHVGKQTLIVYTYAALLASVCTWNVFGIPYKGGIYQGYACLVKDYDD
eukprot:scaffold14172_cov79-Skeletonema_marinoi.AAC.1